MYQMLSTSITKHKHTHALTDMFTHYYHLVLQRSPHCATTTAASEKPIFVNPIICLNGSTKLLLNKCFSFDENALNKDLNNYKRHLNLLLKPNDLRTDIIYTYNFIIL